MTTRKSRAKPKPEPVDVPLYVRESLVEMVLAGDLNSGAGDLPFELLRACSGLQPAAPDLGRGSGARGAAIDWVLLRSGTSRNFLSTTL